MSVSLVESSVRASALTTTYTTNTKPKVGDTASTAIKIGNLDQQGQTIKVQTGGSETGAQTYDFTLNDGDNAFLSSEISNVVDKAVTRIQLYDSNGTVLADSQGTDEQIYAYGQLTSKGYAPGAGNYRVVATPGTYEGAPQITLTKLEVQGTSLSVSSALNSQEPQEYYSFTLGNSKNLKLDFLSAQSTSVRIQLYDSKGSVLADNQGSSSERLKFSELTSGTGLKAVSGTYASLDGSFEETSNEYQLKISYVKGVKPTDDGLKYNLKLYSGTNYAVVYQTNVAAPPTTSTAESSVTATRDAKLFTRTDFHKYNEKAQNGVGVGYLKQDKTSLNVFSQLTAFNNTQYYSFVLQNGSTNLKLALKNNSNAKDTTSVRLQVLDSSGGRVIADNFGTSAQRDKFKEITSSKGIETTPGTYVLKATYSPSANKNKTQQYNIKLFSGTTFSASYKTTASSQTYQNARDSGDLSTNTSAKNAIASYLTSVSNGEAVDIISALQTSA